MEGVPNKQVRHRPLLNNPIETGDNYCILNSSASVLVQKRDNINISRQQISYKCNQKRGTKAEKDDFYRCYTVSDLPHATPTSSPTTMRGFAMICLSVACVYLGLLDVADAGSQTLN